VTQNVHEKSAYQDDKELGHRLVACDQKFSSCFLFQDEKILQEGPGDYFL